MIIKRLTHSDKNRCAKKLGLKKLFIVCQLYEPSGKKFTLADTRFYLLYITFNRPIDFLKYDRFTYVYAAAFGCTSEDIIMLVFQYNDFFSINSIPKLVMPWVRGESYKQK